MITQLVGAEVKAIRDLGLHTAKDRVIYEAARKSQAVVMTKDSDFMSLSRAFGTPPQILWITCGNTSNAFLQKILKLTLPTALKLLSQGEAIVEISA